jgi:NADH dehydrogenase [ubiquinone] 1 alpha subcomplex assembly factor 5
VRYVDNADGWLAEEEQFDLLLTALVAHHANFEEDLFAKYLRTLKEDGALIGSTFAEGTLSELYWSYLLAENERYGGISPKVMQMPSLGELGNSLTMAKYKLATVVAHDEQVEFESVVDLLTLLQEMGESGYLRGRRKGVYKDLLLSACALYSSEFGVGDRVRATIGLSKFIGWKQHASQPRSLSPGPHVGSV